MERKSGEMQTGSSCPGLNPKVQPELKTSGLRTKLF